MTTLVLIGFLGGLITGISPCILPVLPVIFMAGGAASARPSLSFAVAPGTGISLGGTSGAQEDHHATRPVPRAPSKWRPYQVVAGLVLSFTAFTLLGSTLLTALHLPQDFIRWAGVVLLVLIGVGMIVPRFMHVLEKPFAVFSKAGRRTGTNGFGLGIVLGAAYVPCAGPVLAAVIVAGSTGRIGADTVALALSFAVGTAIPLLAFALAGRRLTERVSAFSRHQRRVRIAAGATVLALAAGIVTDLPAVLQRALPDYTSALQRSADPGLSRGEGQRSACVDGATTLADCGALPSLKPTAWLNTDGGAAPQGSGATLVDFWAYSCINCQRSIPGIERLYEAYHPYGLQVIGVHSPEYAFEKETANVQSGGDKLGITYPIAVDSDLETWTDFDNHYWPAQYLADAHGQLRYTHFGEGGEATLESLIRRLLADQGNALPDPLFTDDGVEGVAIHRTPETYLGHERAASFAGTEAYSAGTRDYAAPASLGADRFALQGRWTIDAQSISPADDEAELRLMWHGRRVDLVVSGEGDLTWEMDGQSHTQHVSGTPNSMTLVSGDTDSSGLLTVTASKGLALYSFTFG